MDRAAMDTMMEKGIDFDSVTNKWIGMSNIVLDHLKNSKEELKKVKYFIF